MYYHAILVSWCCFSCARATGETPRIIIVGSGASGIAAATRLLQNGFNNVTILEAESRIGGRIYTVPFAGYLVDLGAQWVLGEEDNLSFNMAWPLGLLDHSTSETESAKIFDSSGSLLSEDIGTELLQVYYNHSVDDIPDSFVSKSIGEFLKPKIDEFLNAQTVLTSDQRESLMDMLSLYLMDSIGGDSWFNTSIHREYADCPGDQMLNWKDGGYSTILDILMKKYPDPAQELPVLNNTVLNAEVSQINYNVSGGDIRVVTENGNEYFADHVLVTPSIAVLKADHKTLFNPPLPETKINAIKGIQLGAVVKIYLSYPEPWWTTGNESLPASYIFYWKPEDKIEYANDPEKSWMLGVVEIAHVEHRPRLLCAWVAGPHARQMENISDERIFQQTKKLIRRFMGKAQNLTEPAEMLRSKWLGNKHFRGTWSYRSLETERSGAKPHHLSEPITANGNPVILFAGEATHSNYSTTVHGAIGSGYREADRLIKFYADRESSTSENQF